jgi:hypothetical protein
MRASVWFVSDPHGDVFHTPRPTANAVAQESKVISSTRQGRILRTGDQTER